MAEGLWHEQKYDLLEKTGLLSGKAGCQEFGVLVLNSLTGANDTANLLLFSGLAFQLMGN